MPRRMSEKNMRRLIAGLVAVGAGLLPLMDSVVPLPEAARAVWLIASVLLLGAASVYLALFRPRGKGRGTLCAAVGLCAALFLLTFLSAARPGLADAGWLTLCLFLSRLAMYVLFWVSCALAYRGTRPVVRVLLIAAAACFVYGFGFAEDGGVMPATAAGFLCRAGALIIDN